MTAATTLEMARRRRARRRARLEVNELRTWLLEYDAGQVSLEDLAWAIGAVGASLGSRAARGELRDAAA